jgi:hypothetical protein
MAEAAAHRLQETVDEITGYRKRTKKLVLGLAAALVVAILVAVGCGYLFIRLHDSDVGNCTAGNQTRAQQLQLWDDLFALSAQDATSKPTAKTQRLTGEFLDDVKETYAPVNCSTRYPFW